MRYLISFITFFFVTALAYSQSQGPRNPVAVIDGGGGTINDLWVNPNAASAQDDAYATLVTTTKNKRTNYLQAQNFGFSIPTGSTILGILVEVNRHATAAGGSVNDARVRLIDATGTITLHDEAGILPWPSIDLDNYQSYGGVTNTWTLTDWTAAKINSANFGVAIAAQTSNNNTTFNLFVDEIRIQVYYLPGGASRYAVASGLWTNTSTWSTTAGGPPGASAPADANDVFIGGGFTVTYNSAVTVNSLTIGTTESNPVGNLTFDANGRSLTVYQGGLVITANGNVLSAFSSFINVAGDVTLNAVLTNPNLTITMDGGLTSSIILTGTGTMSGLLIQSPVNHTGNITVAKALGSDAPLQLINASSAHLTYQGPTTAITSNALDLSAAGNTVEFSQTLVDAASFDVHKPSATYSNLIIAGNAPKFYNGNITINGDLTITSTGILNNSSTSGITLLGNWTNNNGIPGFVQGSCNGCTVIFSGGNAQTITNSAGEQFHRIEINKTAGTVVTASNNIVINNQLLMTAGNFDVASNSLTGAAATIFNGGELSIGTIGSTVPALTGTYTITSGIINFTGAGNQTIRSSTSSPVITTYRTVRFLGSGTKSLSGAITVSTNLTIGGSATLDVTPSNFGITLGGSWTSTGIFLPRTGTVLLNGTVTQIITNLIGETFNNLTINNTTAASAIILNGPVSVNGLLTFTDGHVVTTGTNLLTLGVSATIASVSDASHVAGPLAKVKNTTAVFAFPIGTGANYMPASLTPTSTAVTTFVAQYFSLEQSVGSKDLDVDHVSAQDYWTIERTSGIADAAVTLVWEYSSSAESEINNLPELLVAKWDGSNWASQGNVGTTGTVVAGSVKSNTVTSFTPQYFVIGSSTVNNPLSNYRYFAVPTGNWNSPGVWAYRLGGPTNAPEPTATKLVVIQTGNTATILDSPGAQATKFMESLTILGTLALGNAASADVTVHVGEKGLTLGALGNITGTDNGDKIEMSGNISLTNTSNLSHTLLETIFVTTGNNVTGNGGRLPILNVNQSNQTFSGTTSFTNLIIGGTAVNNGIITITGSLSGNNVLTNSAVGTINWQGTTVAGKVINAGAPGNSIQLVNNTGGSLDIDQFVSTDIFGNLALSGANAFIQGSNSSILGTLTILPGGIFNISSNNNLTISGDLTNSGTFNATAGTVTFNGTTLIGGTSTSIFNHVTISGFVTPTNIFNLRGNFTNSGTFDAVAGTVVFNGTAAQSISGSVVTTFNNISVTNSSAAVQVNSNQNMAGRLTLSAGSVFDADGSGNTSIFSMLSTADSPTVDASIATLPVGASVTGQVTIHRHMSLEGNNGGRIYRYISSPLQNAPVSQIQPNIPVTGTFAGSSSCTGCTTNPSMFLYSEPVITDTNGSGIADLNDGYVAFPTTSNSEIFSPGRGYTIFVRGNVEPVLGIGSAKWTLRGPINSGNISLPVTFTSSGIIANDGWNLVGNPYPSTIDWDAAGWTRSNLDNTTYMLDNGLASPVFATHVAGGASTNGGSRYIATGQAFFVKSNAAAPVLQATEAVKAAGTQTTYFRTTAMEDIIRITLRQGTKADEAVIQFRPKATSDFDLNADAYKLDNPAPMYSLATVTSGVRYVINALPAPTDSTTVLLDISAVTAGKYSLEFTEFESFVNPLTSIVLVDNFLGKTTNIRFNTKYAFDVTADAKSFGNSRFAIVFKVPETPATHSLANLAIYPNPTKNIFSVEVKSDNEVTAKVISLTGALLHEQQLHGGAVKTGSFNLEELSEGIYILLIQDGAQQVRSRIIKSR